MKKLFFTVLCIGLYITSFADSGKIGTSYDGAVKNSYGECVHNSYYDDATTDTECNDKASVSQK